jgi:hypothetical protein
MRYSWYKPSTKTILGYECCEIWHSAKDGGPEYALIGVDGHIWQKNDDELRCFVVQGKNERIVDFLNVELPWYVALLRVPLRSSLQAKLAKKQANNFNDLRFGVND